MSNYVLVFVMISLNFSFIVADKVPVLIWSNDRTVTVPQPLAAHTVEHTEFTRQYLDAIAAHDQLNIVIFVQDKLSIDDITRGAAVFTDSEDDDVFVHLKSIMSSMSVSQLPSVNSPSSALAELKKYFQPSSVHQLLSPYHIGDLSLSAVQHNLIVVQLPETAPGGPAYLQSLRNIDEIVGSVTSQLKALSMPFVALYTASRATSKQRKQEQLKHSGRQLLEDTATTAAVDQVALMVNYSGEFFVYVKSIVLSVNNSGVYNLSTTAWNISETYSDCANSSGTECKVVATYDGEGSALGDVMLTLVASKTGGNNVGYWYLTTFQLTYQHNGQPVNIHLNPKFVEHTPFYYSYHCNKPYPILSINSSDIDANVTFTDLQIQAFGIRQDKFGYYNDCMGFFSIPIWMGLISSAVLLAILLFGIIMLLDIKSMDRYDDPKGKTITITATD